MTEEGLAELKLEIKGIHCAHCADDLIEGTLLNRPGIEGATYDSSSSVLIVAYERQMISENEVRGLVEEWGYEAKPFPAQGSGVNSRYKAVSMIIALLLLVIFIWWIRSI